MTPKLITFEGSEGAGKTTQIHHLIERLEQHGIPYLVTREPGGTPLGEAIRHILKFSGPEVRICPSAEVLLFCASRAQLAEEVIRPALAQGRVVICDRFFDSTTVYQGVGRGIPPEHILALRRLSLGDLWPDLTFVLHMDPHAARERALRRTELEGHDPDRLEAEPLEFYQRISDAYQDLARQEPHRLHLIPADRDPEEIARQIWSITAHALDIPTSP